MNNNNLPIAPIDLTKEEKQDLEQTMRVGNLRLKHWHTVIKRQNKLGKNFTRLKLGGDLVRCFQNKCHNGALNYGGPTDSPIASVSIPHDDLLKIKAVHDIQPKVMAGYIKIVGSIANKWNKKGNDVSLSIADLIAEGVRILLNCTWYFTDDNQFITFAYYSVERRITLVCTRTSPLSEKTEHAAKLLRDYKKTKINFNGPCNFDEVCDKMGLNQEDRVLLERMQIGVVGGLTAEGKDKVSTDYSVRALNFGNYSVVAHQNGVGNIIRNNDFAHDDYGLNYEAIIQEANLNEFEKAVLEAWMDASDDRWRANFAETYISPISFKKVTRQRVAQVAKDVERKIRNAAQKHLQEQAA